MTNGAQLKTNNTDDILEEPKPNIVMDLNLNNLSS